jgi:nitrate reductase NapE component
LVDGSNSSESDSVRGARKINLRVKLIATLLLVFALAAILTLGVAGAFSSTEPDYSATSPTASGSP